MIPFEIFDSYALTIQGTKPLQNRQIADKGKGFSDKTEKELEQVSQDHQGAHSLSLRIQKSEEFLHLSSLSTGEVGIGDEYPVLFSTDQSQPLPTPE